MLYIKECINEDTPVQVISESKKKSIFSKKEPEVFHKIFNHAEFIGEELCNIQNIRCTHYFLAAITKLKINKTMKCGSVTKYSPSLEIASYDFRDKDKKYKYLDDYEKKANNGFESMLKNTKNENNKRQLCEDMLQMLALDIYMGQTDRSKVNFMFEEDKEGNIRLAPLYDFEHSLNSTCLDRNHLYYNDLYSFDTIEDCKEFIKQYPRFRDILASYLNVDLIDVISRCYSRRGLTIPSDKWRFYVDFQEERKDTIQKIIKRA